MYPDEELPQVIGQDIVLLLLNIFKLFPNAKYNILNIGSAITRWEHLHSSIICIFICFFLTILLALLAFPSNKYPLNYGKNRVLSILKKILTWYIINNIVQCGCQDWGVWWSYWAGIRFESYRREPITFVSGKLIVLCIWYRFKLTNWVMYSP